MSGDPAGAGAADAADPGPPDERALRRPGFRGGTEVVLCDGRAWSFPTPRLVPGEFYLATPAGGATEMRSASDFGPAYERLVDRFVEAEGVGQYEALFDAALHLLGLNYDLTAGDARGLLRVRLAPHPGADENAAMWGAVADVVTGRAPKAGPVGSGPA